MNKLTLPALALALVTAGCQQKLAEPVSEADANKAFDAAKAAWASTDAAKIDALYGEGFVGFDLYAAPVIDGLDALKGFNQKFAAMKLDGLTVSDNKIQRLDADTFTATGISHFTSSTGQVREIDIRYTEVFQKQSDGGWKIVAEHISALPKGEGQ